VTPPKFTRRTGWYGNSQGHALAAKGIKLYAKKSTPALVDPVFYARRDKQISFDVILDAVSEGKTYHQIKQAHPDSDSEDLRLRGIKAYEMRSGSNTLSVIDKNGVDSTVRMTRHDPSFKERTNEVLADPQASSFLPVIKVQSIKEGISQ
jgi:hypothetical protein